MDITNTILGAVLFSFIIGPIYIINKNVKKKKSQALKALNELSVDKNDKFIEADFWNNDFGIGLKSEELCFIGKYEDSVFKDVIRMKEIKKCTIVKIGKSGVPKIPKIKNAPTIQPKANNPKSPPRIYRITFQIPLLALLM